MKENQLIKKILCMFIIGSLILSFGLVGFAENGNTGCPSCGKCSKEMSYNKKSPEMFQTVLRKLVDEGTIDQKKADGILQYVDQKLKERKQMTKEQRRAQKFGLMESMKNDGIVTDAELQAIKNKFREIREQRLTENLNKLVEKGVITANDVETIKSYFKAAMDERIKEFEKMKGMTQEERKAYFEANRKERKGVIEKLVEDGKITEVQAKELREIMPKHHKNHLNKE